MYREAGEKWRKYRNALQEKLIDEAKSVQIGGKTLSHWNQGYIGPVYTTSLNLIVLQLDRACLPIYQR